MRKGSGFRVPDSAYRIPPDHHTRQTGCLTIFAVAGQLKAFWNSGMLETTPFAR